MKLYIAVINDKYELPVYIALTPGELAERFGMTTNLLRNYMCLGKVKNCGSEGKLKFLRVEIDDDELLKEQLKEKKTRRKEYTKERVDPRCKETIVFNTRTEEIRVFPSCKDAEEFLGMTTKYITTRMWKLKTNEFRYKDYIVKVGDKT